MDKFFEIIFLHHYMDITMINTTQSSSLRQAGIRTIEKFQKQW